MIGAILGLANPVHPRTGYTQGSTTAFAPADLYTFYDETPIGAIVGPAHSVAVKQRL